ncbi:uncharacterized protein BJ171DRAFT_454213 [Polychytrium aggregatum]|uniref:uncharacterized protein n=1 Tax=Polychytrium aggregatum TaxID=110093 RepID=UPI0022FE93A8|nr:uncharacterized protein BJ171DRAFT_454213 [Polychytrium aggregatum]KAI9209236.1 hypothetical protein BJ171DRAFT_454213 [Polychytrium aggregatum]
MASSSTSDTTGSALMYPDIFTIVCFNECFQLALDLATIKTLLRVCKRAHPLLSSKVARLHSWCRKAGLCRPDRSPRIVLTPSDQISLSLHCKDQAEADRSWLENQSSWDNAAASYLLARILQVEIDRGGMRPLRVEAKSRRVFDLLETAANSSHPMAQFHLAKCYQNGHGVDQDSTKAVELYCSLANRGILQAQISLGRCYDSGLGVEQDSTAASKWYSKAAHQGNGDGSLHFRLGMCYRYGWGARKSYSRAIRWFRKAADLGNSYAPWMAGQCYHYGYGVTTNYEKAAKWYRRSAKRGNRYGQWQLGYCYKDGFGVKSDIDKAKYWYRKAADQDFDIPAISLRELENVR